MEAALPAAHGTGLGLFLWKAFHWTCIGSMVAMAAAHGGSLLTMASNFVNMHILPGLAAIPQGVANLTGAFAHAVGVGAAPPIDPSIVMDHSVHAAHGVSGAATSMLQADWMQAASPDLKAAVTALPPEVLEKFNQSSLGIKQYVVENYSSLHETGRSLESIVGDICQPR